MIYKTDDTDSNNNDMKKQNTLFASYPPAMSDNETPYPSVSEYSPLLGTGDSSTLDSTTTRTSNVKWACDQREEQEDDNASTCSSTYDSERNTQNNSPKSDLDGFYNNLESNDEDEDDEMQYEPFQEKETPKPILERTIHKCAQLYNKIDSNAFQFALRMGVMLGVSGLFVIAHTATWHYPDGMWVLISVLFVCWFPSLEAARVMEKVFQRMLGTLIGATLGFACGFSSELIASKNGRDAFVIICMFFFNFLIVFVAGQWKLSRTSNRVKVLGKYAYSTILCVLTFCITLLPFADDGKQLEEPWKRGLSRVINVTIGCLLGAVGAVVVCPKSTIDTLYQKTSRQVTLAGIAGETLLHTASEYFTLPDTTDDAKEMLLKPLHKSVRWSLLQSSSRGNSEIGLAKAYLALRKYEDAIMDIRDTNDVFAYVRFDPFSLHRQESGKKRKLHKEIARTLVRAMRMQTTIVVMDGMLHQDADYDLFTEKQIRLFAQVGVLIRQMLTVPLKTEHCNTAAVQLFRILDETRTDVFVLSTAVANSVAGGTYHDPMHHLSVQVFEQRLLDEDSDDYYDEDEWKRQGAFRRGKDGRSKNPTVRPDNSLLFLQLLEHLILRSLRLYKAWKYVAKLKRELSNE